jgi:SAM-dependent methyltransferase
MANEAAISCRRDGLTGETADTGKLQQQPRTNVRSGPLIINLGCGVKTSDRCINVDWSIYIVLSQNRWLLPLVTPLVGRDRVERIKAMRGATICHNLRRGVPFPADSADAVYHSHLMEHIDRDAVLTFQKEMLRVLKPGGIQRLCVPDLELLIGDYHRSFAADDLSREASIHHDMSVTAMFEQSVRRASSAAWRRNGFRLWLENLVLGDARARGETHQWMWDRVNIRAVLRDAGFTDIRVQSWDVSDIEGWEQTGLERAGDGTEYKPRSLYVECRKPVDA